MVRTEDHSIGWSPVKYTTSNYFFALNCTVPQTIRTTPTSTKMVDRLLELFKYMLTYVSIWVTLAKFEKIFLANSANTELRTIPSKPADVDRTPIIRKNCFI